MSILIIGGSGFIGKQLCKSLLEDGETVIVKTRNSIATNKTFKTLNCSPHIIESYAELDNTEFKPSIVISLAGAGVVDKRWSKQRKKQLIESRTKPIEEFKAWLEKTDSHIDTFLAGSAIGYYGYGDDPNIELQEDSAAQPDFVHKICQQLESSAAQLKSHCKNIISLRTGVVLGHGAALEKMALPAKFHLNGKIGHGKQWVSWIHIQDWINATKYILSLDAPRETYNLTSPNPVSNEQLSQAIGKALNKPFQIPVPALSLKLLLGEASVLLLGSQKVLPANLEEANFEFKFPSIKSACQDLLGKTRSRED
jgi:uncharacterized protein (TIGR01777 family)